MVNGDRHEIISPNKKMQQEFLDSLLSKESGIWHQIGNSERPNYCIKSDHIMAIEWDE